MHRLLRTRVLALCGVALFVLSGCLGSTPPTQFYLVPPITGDTAPPAAAGQRDLTLAVGPAEGGEHACVCRADSPCKHCTRQGGCTRTQQDHPLIHTVRWHPGARRRSTSPGDVVVLSNGQAYRCDFIGWQPLELPAPGFWTNLVTSLRRSGPRSLGG